jgi:tRNA pseudouridine55 synthase
MFGLLNLNKPSGVSSRDVVNQVQRLVHPAKAGHAGTLDPLAEGVLIVCLGPATRLVSYVQGMPKRYRGTFLLGRHSDTEDITGKVVELPDAPIPTRTQLEETLRRFEGEIEQRPPVYSAKKVRGVRAYKLARRGKRPKLAARTVVIHRIELVALQYPEMTLDVTCGSGTYVRSLGRDVGEAVGSAAVMSALTREAVGDFRLEDAADPEQLTRANLPRHLLPAARAVPHLPVVTITAEEEMDISQGLSIPRRGLTWGGEYAALDQTGRLRAILVPRSASQVGPTRYFPVNSR